MVHEKQQLTSFNHICKVTQTQENVPRSVLWAASVVFVYDNIFSMFVFVFVFVHKSFQWQIIFIQVIQIESCKFTESKKNEKRRERERENTNVFYHVIRWFTPFTLKFTALTFYESTIIFFTISACFSFHFYSFHTLTTHICCSFI